MAIFDIHLFAEESFADYQDKGGRLDCLISVRVECAYASCYQASGDFDKSTSFQSEINDDHLYRDAEYSFD